MSEKKTCPAIGDKHISPDGPGFRSLQFRVLSPTGVIMSRDLGGVGLGIVAALGNVPKADFRGRNRMCSDPIRVMQSRTVEKSKKKVAKVYLGGKRAEIRKKGCIFNISPADDDVRVPQPVGYLNSCHLCNKGLHGKDIYMYRGEKAFCSPECRSRQIAMDERPEKYCSSQATSSGQRNFCNRGPNIELAC